MSETALALLPEAKPLPEPSGLDALRSAVLHGVTAENSRRNYALDE